MAYRLAASGLQDLFDALVKDGYQIIGPTRAEAAIVYDVLSSPEDLPIGWTDVQRPGEYRLETRPDRARFGHHPTPQAFKKFFHPAEQTLFRAELTPQSRLRIIDQPEPTLKRALIGARACELAAVFVQDRVLAKGPHVDPRYVQRRTDTLVVAVHCTEAGGTCFCASMNTGPRVNSGFDLALTELLDQPDPTYLVEVGSDAGQAYVNALELQPASTQDIARGRDAMDRAVAQMPRRMNPDGLPEFLQANLEHPHWDNVANRCLACGNCTMVCPTCFCTSTEDHTNLTGESSVRTQVWDSCFTKDFSYLHGGAIRPSIRARYRQWLTHKLGTWHDQFHTSGCVGCGRCITWCPVGIDLTEEVAMLTSAPEAS